MGKHVNSMRSSTHSTCLIATKTTTHGWMVSIQSTVLPPLLLYSSLTTAKKNHPQTGGVLLGALLRTNMSLCISPAQRRRLLRILACHLEILTELKRRVMNRSHLHHHHNDKVSAEGSAS